MELKPHIRNIPDFPKPGIVFRDITPILANPEVFSAVADEITDAFADGGVTAVAGIESRGFLFGIAVAERLGVGFVPVRKKGKLPGETVAETYALEYGEDTLEIHADAVGKGDRVLVVDDLLATGGTARATARLVERLGAEVEGLAFVVELSFLAGRDKLAGWRLLSLVDYDSE